MSILNRSEMFYNKEEIPESESNETAHKLCSTISGAMKHCPVRWSAMENWFAHAHEVRQSTEPVKPLWEISLNCSIVSYGLRQVGTSVQCKRIGGFGGENGTFIKRQQCYL